MTTARDPAGQGPAPRCRPAAAARPPGDSRTCTPTGRRSPSPRSLPRARCTARSSTGTPTCTLPSSRPLPTPPPTVPASTAISHRSVLAENANLHEQNRRLAQQVTDLEDRLSELLGQQAFDRSGLGAPRQHRRRPGRARRPAPSRPGPPANAGRTRRGTRRGPRGQPQADEPGQPLRRLNRHHHWLSHVLAASAIWSQFGCYDRPTCSRGCSRWVTLCVTAGSQAGVRLHAVKSLPGGRNIRLIEPEGAAVVP